MIRAIIWKEFREQGLIALMLLVLGSGILAAAAILADPASANPGSGSLLRVLSGGVMATLLLAVTAGTVCGGALFAAERESGTLGFLESLPTSRWQLWRAKFLAGSLLATLQIVLVLGVAIALGLIETSGAAFAIIVYSLLAFCWGMYGSTLARTTLGSVGIAIPSATFAALIFIVPIMAMDPNPRTNMPRVEGAIAFLCLMFGTPLLGSAYRFTRQDRDRAAEDREAMANSTATGAPGGAEPSSRARAGAPRHGVQALVWLAARQLLVPGAVISAFAILMGLSLLADNFQSVLMWPVLGLAAGVIAGVTCFADEQSHGSARFWGERRLPLGRLWIIKIFLHALFALWLGFLILLPGFVRGQVDSSLEGSGGTILSGVFHSLLLDGTQLGSQSWKILALPIAYGFAAGHLCSLLFRKVVVAAGVAGLVGGTAGAFWLPSLVSGGVHHWQLWAPPVLALVTGRWLLRAWASERLATRPSLLALGGGVAAAFAAIGVGIGYRVLEVANHPGSEDDQEYVAGLPPMELNDSGRFFRGAAERYARVVRGMSLSSDRLPTATSRRASLDDRVLNLPFAGWKAGEADITEWLNKVYNDDQPAAVQDEPWHVQAARAGRERLGIFEHPMRTGTPAALLTQQHARRMGATLLAHGLKLQAEGDPAAFVSDLRTALALGRSMRQGSVISALLYGNDIGNTGFAGIEHWLTALRGQPELLEEAVRVLQEDDGTEPFDPRPHLLAERYVMREYAKSPGQWLPAQLTPVGHDREQVSPVVDAIAVAWSMPWERERTRRLLGVGFEAGNRPREDRALLRGRPGWTFWIRHGPSPADLTEFDRKLRVNRRSAILALAIRLHIEKKGSPPASLNDLVANGCLSSVPLDPYDDRPFRYRVSAGEALPPVPVGPSSQGGSLMPIRPARQPESQRIPAGQPILWSVGADRVDSGGRSVPTRFGLASNGGDFVYLVPLPAAP